MENDLNDSRSTERAYDVLRSVLEHPSDHKAHRKWIRHLFTYYRFWPQNSIEHEIIVSAMRTSASLAKRKNDETHKLCHNTCVYLFMGEKILTDREVASLLHINVRTVHKYVNRLTSILEIIIFGIDGVEFSPIQVQEGDRHECLASEI